MKGIILTLILNFCYFIVAPCQSIVGLWQAETATVTSGYLDTYQFYTDGSFKFNINQSEGLSRVISIGGKYKLKNGKIEFTPEYTIERVGGEVSRSEITTGSDSWELMNPQIKKIALAQKLKQSAIFEIGKKINGKDNIKIDLRRFFKMDNNPNSFE